MARRAERARLLRLEDEMAILQAGNIGLGKKLLVLSRQLQGQGSVAPRGHATAEGQTYAAVSGSAATWATIDEVPARPSAQARSAAAEVKAPRHHLRSVPAPADASQDDLFEPEFERAQQLLSQGIGIAQVVQQTGLTRSEAELIQLLHPLAGSR